MIKPLTSLRFFFALMIFAFHLDTIILKTNSVFLKQFYSSVLEEGFIGVSFFFLLSGFILAYNYQEPLLNKTKTKYSFFIARFARIYPLHILCFLISIPLSFTSFPPSLDSTWLINALLNLTLTQSFSLNPATIFSFNAPSWSISNEMFFYLIFPFLIPLIYKTAKSKYKYILFFIFILIIPGLNILLPESQDNIRPQLFYVNPFIRVFDFILGILLFNLYKKIKDTDFIKSVNFNYWEIFSASLLILFFIFHSYFPKTLRFSVYYWIPISLLILVFSFQKGYLSTLLSHKKLIFLGEISFGFYMIHLLVLRYMGVPFFFFFPTALQNPYIALTVIAVSFCITLLLSYYSFIRFETPVNKYLKKRLKK